MCPHCALQCLWTNLISKEPTGERSIAITGQGKRVTDSKGNTVIYSSIDLQNGADTSPHLRASGRGRDIKNSLEDGRRCHIEYVASCSDDHG